MKKQVFYIHGGESFVDYGVFLTGLGKRTIRDLPNTEKKIKWVDNLSEDLGEEYEVFTPQMPNKQNAKYEEWKIWFERHFEFLHDDVILIGCSLGAMFLSRYFVENDVPFRVEALFVMASPVEFDDDCGDFTFELSSVTKIKDKVEKVYILHSKDDHLVPYEHALKYKEALSDAELVTFEDKNHFLVEELPELVELIKNSA